MTSTSVVFCSTSDGELVRLIDEAQRRLIVVSPALTEPVATALLAKIENARPTECDRVRDPIQITVVLDDSPEAYRLGYGEAAANHLKRFREAADQGSIRFQVEPGVRIGVVISDENSLVFAPTPQLVEAPPTASMARANAIQISGPEADRLARASGWAPPTDHPPGRDHGSESGVPTPPPPPEIGLKPFTSDAASNVARDLENNPPEPFDLSRRVRVFSSKVKYVEIKVSNAKIDAKKVSLPTELLGIANADLKERIGGELRPPAELLKLFPVEIEMANGERERKDVDSKWFDAERRRIAREYTFVVPGYGRLIYTTRWPDFKAETGRLRRNLKAYHTELAKTADTSKAVLETRLVDEFLANLKRNPPKHLTRHRGGGVPSDDDLRWYLGHEIRRVVSKMLTIARPEVRVVRKNVAPESVREPGFMAGLEKRLPPGEIESLFTSHDAAPSRESAAPDQPRHDR